MRNIRSRSTSLEAATREPGAHAAVDVGQEAKLCYAESTL